MKSVNTGIVKALNYERSIGMKITHEQINDIASKLSSTANLMIEQIDRSYLASTQSELLQFILTSTRLEVQLKMCIVMPDDWYTTNCRERHLALPRQIAMYLIKKHTVLSLKAIGAKFGHRHHSTVLHAVAVIEDMILLNHPPTKWVKEFIDRIDKELNSQA